MLRWFSQNKAFPIFFRRAFADFALRGIWEFESSTRFLPSGVTPSSLANSERGILLKEMYIRGPYRSICEVGFGAGSQLELTLQCFPNADIICTDVDGTLAENLQDLEGLGPRLKFVEEDLTLPCAEQISVEATYSIACLLLIDPDNIIKVLQKLIDRSTKYVFLLEQDIPGLMLGELRTDRTSYWLRDYIWCTNHLSGIKKTQRIPVSTPTWIVEQWQSSATLIIYTLE